jgi:hypothetical protein
MSSRTLAMLLITYAIGVSGCSAEQSITSDIRQEIDCSDGSNIIFYNASTRGGAVGKLKTDGFCTTTVYSQGAFGSWTHIARTSDVNSLLFYNINTGAGASGYLDMGRFVNVQTLGGFALGWTSILDAKLHHDTVSLPLFYNSATGSGAVGYAPTVRVYPSGAFALGWTHIVADWNGILFYNSHTGAGAVAVPIDSTSTNLGAFDDIRTTRVYAPGSFSTNWTNIVSAGSSIFFYNSTNGSAAIGRLLPQVVFGATEFRTDRVYSAGSFNTGWSHIVYANGALLFYNNNTGQGEIGTITNGIYSTSVRYPTGAFASGWTHIVATSFDLLSSPPH